jgi:hypothetical protein
MSEAIGFQLHEKVQALQDALLHKHPTMPVLLREIHTALKKQPENVTLLSEEEIKVIVNGLEKQTNIALIESVTKAKTPSTKAKLNNLEAF